MVNTLRIESVTIDIPDLVLGVSSPLAEQLFRIENLSGLAPMPADFETGRMAAAQGLSIISTRHEARYPKLSLGYSEVDVEEARQILYKYFMTGSKLRLHITTDELPPIYIDVVVKNIDTEIFSATAEQTVDIEMIAPDPYLRELGSISNQIETNSKGEFVINYSGTVPAGFIMQVQMPSNLSDDFTIKKIVRHSDPEQPYRDQVFALYNMTVAKDKWIHYDTLPFRRAIGIKDSATSGTYLPTLLHLKPGSEWMMLTPGPNNFQVVRGSSANVKFDVEYTYWNRYGGL